MINNYPIVFQADAKQIIDIYNKVDNYLIEYDNSKSSEYCIIYFSSNNIYFPNTPDAFNEAIVEKNKFEWYNTRIRKGHKHIFIRDIKKQWYLTGTNKILNNPAKLLDFLKVEAKGYKIITLGSSAGGFASVLFGQQLNAQMIYSFNGQFEVNSQLIKSKPTVDPVLFREQHNDFLRKFYDIKPFIKNAQSVHYFTSANSNWDIDQYLHVKDLKMKIYRFNTDHHGIPFIKTALSDVLNMEEQKLTEFSKKELHPIWFSIRIAGFLKTTKGLYQAAKVVIRNKIKN